MPAVTLSQVARGIDRTRVRGNVQPDGLYELTNAYVTPARVIRKRPGFRRIGSVPAQIQEPAQLVWEGKGLASLNGKLVFFSDEYRGASGVPGAADVRVLRYIPRPGIDDPGAGATARLVTVRMVGVFLGRLYVAADWVLSNNARAIRHYWITDPPTWDSVEPYELNDVVKADPDNGFVYRLTAVPEINAWRPSTEYTVGASVQPTEYNGYRYELVEHVDTPLVSGDTEPDWPRSTKPGSNRVTESRSPTAVVAAKPPPGPSAPPPTPPPGPSGEVRREYGVRWREGGRFWERPEWQIE